MRYKDILLEYNQPALIKALGKKLLQKWAKENNISIEQIDDPDKKIIELLDWIEKSDPSPNGKYVKWIVKMYVGNDIWRWEDIPTRIRPALEAHIKLQEKIKSIEDVVEQYKK